MHSTMKAAMLAAGDGVDAAALKLGYHPNYLRAVLNGKYPVGLKLARAFGNVYPDWADVGRAAFGYQFDAGRTAGAKKIPVAS